MHRIRRRIMAVVGSHGDPTPTGRLELHKEVSARRPRRVAAFAIVERMSTSVYHQCKRLHSSSNGLGSPFYFTSRRFRPAATVGRVLLRHTLRRIMPGRRGDHASTGRLELHKEVSARRPRRVTAFAIKQDRQDACPASSFHALTGHGSAGRFALPFPAPSFDEVRQAPETANPCESGIAEGGSRPPGAMDAGQRKRPRLNSETLDSSTMPSLLNSYRARRSRSTSLLNCIGRSMERRIGCGPPYHEPISGE
jgi:hypothetical protein